MHLHLSTPIMNFCNSFLCVDYLIIWRRFAARGNLLGSRQGLHSTRYSNTQYRIHNIHTQIHNTIHKIHNTTTKLWVQAKVCTIPVPLTYHNMTSTRSSSSSSSSFLYWFFSVTFHNKIVIATFTLSVGSCQPYCNVWAPLLCFLVIIIMIAVGMLSTPGRIWFQCFAAILRWKLRS